MKKLATIAGALAVAASMAITATPASAQSFSFGFNSGPSYWNGQNYHRQHQRHYYPRHRSGISFGFGGVDIRVNPSRNRGHIARCEDRYRSYNRRTDMYLGYDGDYHRCRL